MNVQSFCHLLILLVIGAPFVGQETRVRLDDPAGVTCRADLECAIYDTAEKAYLVEHTDTGWRIKDRYSIPSWNSIDIAPHEGLYLGTGGGLVVVYADGRSKKFLDDTVLSVRALGNGNISALTGSKLFMVDSTGQRVSSTELPHPGAYWGVFSSDGEIATIFDGSGHLSFWKFKDGQYIAGCAINAERFFTHRLGVNSKWAAFPFGGMLQTVDTQTCQRAEIKISTDQLEDIAVGNRDIALADRSGAVRMVDPETGSSRVVAHFETPVRLAFVPESRKLVVLAKDGLHIVE